MTTIYPLGKLPADHLSRLLKTCTTDDPRLVLGGAIGEDAAVIDMGDRYLIAKTDPITFATDEIGWYAVNVNANDVACMGAAPRWFLATLLLPEGQTTPALVDAIFQQMHAACNALGISMAGGHTEITYGLSRPIVVGQMLGEVAAERLILTAGARPGDDLLLTKAIAIEGTAIIAREKGDALQDLYAPPALERLANLLHTPGISIVPEARTAAEVAGVHAMHDPTEGGIATGLWELSAAANVGVEVFADRLPFHPDCLTLCRRFGLDPLGLIASGSLLLAVEPSATAKVVRRLRARRIEVTVIGRLHPPGFGLQLTDPGGSRPLPTFPRDEIARLSE